MALGATFCKSCGQPVVLQPIAETQPPAYVVQAAVKTTEASQPSPKKKMITSMIIGFFIALAAIVLVLIIVVFRNIPRGTSSAPALSNESTIAEINNPGHLYSDYLGTGITKENIQEVKSFSGNGSTETSTVASDGYSTFTLPAEFISVRIPADWAGKEDNGSVDFTSSDNTVLNLTYLNRKPTDTLESLSKRFADHAGASTVTKLANGDMLIIDNPAEHTDTRHQAVIMTQSPQNDDRIYATKLTGEGASYFRNVGILGLVVRDRKIDWAGIGNSSK